MCIDKMRYIMIGCALALIALAGCKTPELSMDERISLPESGEMGMERHYVREAVVVGCLFPRYLIARLCGCGFTQ